MARGTEAMKWNNLASGKDFLLLKLTQTNACHCFTSKGYADFILDGFRTQ